MISCPICGNTLHECKEWRHCPKMDNQLICGSEHCKVCESFRKPEDVGTSWCTYYHGRAESHKADISGLELQIERKDELARKYYAKNKPKAAERTIWEMVGLQTKLREAKK